jgi:DNA-binding NtrC family response regulator
MSGATNQPTVLVVDDHSNMLRLMTKILGEDARVITARGGREAIDLLSRERVSVVLADLSMPEVDGLEVFRACKRLQPTTELVLMTAYASVPSAVEALRLGAFEYLTKPFEPELARAAVLRALGRRVDLAALPWTQALQEARASAARYYLEEVLRRHGNNVSEAAAHAGVERESFYRLLRRFGAKALDRQASEPSVGPDPAEPSDDE